MGLLPKKKSYCCILRNSMTGEPKCINMKYRFRFMAEASCFARGYWDNRSNGTLVSGKCGDKPECLRQ